MKREEVIRELKNRGFIVEEQTVIRNGFSKTGICLKNASNIHPIINLDQIIKAAESCHKTVSEVADKIVSLLKENSKDDSLGAMFTDRKFVRDHLYVGMQKPSEEELVRVPCPIPDVEAYLMVKFAQNANSTYDAKMTMDYLNALNIDKEDAVRTAIEHICTDTKLVDLMELAPIPYENRGFMYVLTNTESRKGAACILNREALLELSMKTHSRRLVCIPSSIHEWIIVPHGDSFPVEDLKEMIRFVNSSQVPPEEQLSDEPYILDIARYLN